MRNIIKGVALFFSISIFILVLLDVSMGGTKHNETSDLANTAPYEALKVKLTGEYDLEDNEDLVAELVRNVVMTKYTNSDIKIQILGIDAKNGLIDINVIQTVKHSNGTTTTQEERRTVIVETEKKDAKYIFDFNNDNIVDKDDVQFVQDYINKKNNAKLSDEQLSLIDLNGDNIVDQTDVNMFKKKVVDGDSDIFQKGYLN